MRAEPGTRIGKYRFLRLLAVGGMGEVWVARNEATGADVAAKMRRGDGAGAEAALRFRHEAHLGAMLSHRSIVRVFDLLEEPDGTLLLVMELLRGETLERYLGAHGPLPAADAVAIALPLLSALAHAHDSSVVHRDVTPANVFLAIDPDGHVTPKLVDFGIAKLPESGVRTLDGRVLGTPRYMAPERIRDRGDVDGRSDLFSVGVVLYEMLTGTCPFDASSPAASLAAVLELVVDPDPRIDPRLWLEIQRALAKRPYERHAGAREMADALRSAIGHTDASLAEILRRAPPPLQRPSGKVSTEARTRSVGGQSWTGALPGRRGAMAAWVLGAVALTAVALAATVAVGRHGPAAAGAAPEGASPAPATALPSALPAQPTVAVTAPPASATPVPPATSQPTPRHQAAPKRARPVATTPGF